MMAAGPMYSFFDPKFDETEPDENGRIPPFKSGPIRMFNVDDGDTTLSVPIFMRFLRRRSAFKQCTICAESLSDIDFDSVEKWMKMCGRFSGEWMWKILLFPERLRMACDHDMDVCCNCLKIHLETSLAGYGRSQCDKLACPSDGCGRRLEYAEVREYADPETFAT